MDKVDHGQKTIKGQIDSKLNLGTTQSSGKSILRTTVHATDNAIYDIMTMQNCEQLYKAFDIGHYVKISGNHQTSRFNDDEKEEIVFAKITRWEPSWKVTSEIINSLSDICTKLLDTELDIQEKLEFLDNVNSMTTEPKLQIAVVSDAFRRHHLALQLLNHECRPLEDDKGIRLVYDGQENINSSPFDTIREVISYPEPDELPFE